MLLFTCVGRKKNGNGFARDGWGGIVAKRTIDFTECGGRTNTFVRNTSVSDIARAAGDAKRCFRRSRENNTRFNNDI